MCNRFERFEEKNHSKREYRSSKQAPCRNQARKTYNSKTQEHENEIQNETYIEEMLVRAFTFF